MRDGAEEVLVHPLFLVPGRHLTRDIPALVRQVEARVRAENKPGGRVERRGNADDPDVVAAEEKLKKALGTPVRIRGSDKGRIEIRFTSVEELDRIFDALMSLGDRRNN